MLLSLMAQCVPVPMCARFYGLVLVEAVSTIATVTADTCANHEGRSLSGHSETTGIDTIVLNQLER